MQFFWPNKLNPSPGALTHVGRALHVLALALAALIIFVSVPIVWYFLNHPLYAGPFGVERAVRHVALAVPAAVLVALLGRGLRYIFSGE